MNNSQGNSDQSALRKSDEFFACPFHKHGELLDPPEQNSCGYSGRGFKNMAELTRHLKKYHTPEIERCQRCSRFFPTQEEFSAHRSDLSGCHRKGTQRGGAQRALWFDLYAVLYPKALPPSNPYYPRQDPSARSDRSAENAAGFSQPLAELQSFIAASMARQPPETRAQSLRALNTWLVQHLDHQTQNYSAQQHLYGNSPVMNRGSFLAHNGYTSSRTLSIPAGPAPDLPWNAMTHQGRHNQFISDPLTGFPEANGQVPEVRMSLPRDLNGPFLDFPYTSPQWSHGNGLSQAQDGSDVMPCQNEPGNGWGNSEAIDSRTSVNHQGLNHVNHRNGWMWQYERNN